MRTWWASASVVALCVFPALAQAKDKGHDRRDDDGRHSSERRHPDRGAKGDRGDRRDGRHDFDRGHGWDRGSRNHDNRDSSDRGWRNRDSRERWDRDRRYDGRWRGAYRHESRRVWPSFRVRPLRHPSGYRYGYFYGHGYYFPRYYYDYDSYTTHASVRIQVEPAETEVYVDGYYAGVVDDFDGLFQRLHLTPGNHEITLRLDGYETWSAPIFAAPDSTVSLHHDMQPGTSEPVTDDPGDDDEPEPNE